MSQFMLGGILFGLSALLMVPSTLGLSEYNNKRTKRKQTSTEKAIAITQMAVFILAVAGLIVGGAIMINDRVKRKLPVDAAAPAAVPAAAPAAVPIPTPTPTPIPTQPLAATISSTKKTGSVGLGGLEQRRSGRRHLEEFELF